MFGMMKFMKEAGQRLSDDPEAMMAEAEEAKRKAKLESYLKNMGFDNDKVELDVKTPGKVTVGGMVITQEMKEKILLAVGNVDGVEEVEDGLTAESASAPSELHEVAKGETLWAISKKYYGKGSRYKEIFEANRPMLSHPDKIYVGQVLRIPMDNPKVS